MLARLGFKGGKKKMFRASSGETVENEDELPPGRRKMKQVDRRTPILTASGGMKRWIWGLLMVSVWFLLWWQTVKTAGTKGTR